LRWLVIGYGLSKLANFKKIISGAGFPVKKYLLRLLIPKPSLLTTVGAGPGDGVAGHAPQIFHHAILAYLKTAATGPAKGDFLTA